MGIRTVSLSRDRTGDPALSGLLANLAAVAAKDAYPLRNITSFTLEGGVTRFAGLGTDEHTNVEIASVTKTFNAELLEQAIERQEVTESTTVAELLGDRYPVVHSSDFSSITLEELANHTSGLPRVGKRPLRNTLAALLGRNPDVGITVDDVFITALRSPLRPRGHKAYSNLGHDVLGNLLALAADTDYPQLVTDRILEPLGMAESYVATPGSVPDTAPRGVSRLGLPVQPWESDGPAPSGGIRSTAHDMALYASYLLQKRLARFTWERIKDTDLYWHNGGTFGFSTMLLIDKVNHRASFVANDSQADIERVAFELLGLADPALKER